MGMSVESAISAFQNFCGANLTATLSQAELALRGANAETIGNALSPFAASNDVLDGAGQLKEIVGQIHVVIHALGIMLCLPKILEPGETINAVSLGAGNTGRKFDLETDRRIAEFKFIRWQGGPETIRQNGLFKDFFSLAEYDSSSRKKELYVLGIEHPLKFFNGGRSLATVLQNVRFYEEFRATVGDEFKTVGDYYRSRKERVAIRDASAWLSGLDSNIL